MVAHMVWDHGAGGSSPFTPTIFCLICKELVEKRILIYKIGAFSSVG